jgi:Family of unknown function (DUF5900)
MQFNPEFYSAKTIYFSVELDPAFYFAADQPVYYSAYHLYKESDILRGLINEFEKGGKAHRSGMKISVCASRQQILDIIRLIETVSDLAAHEYTEEEVRSVYSVAHGYAFKNILTGMNRWIRSHRGTTALSLAQEYFERSDYNRMVNEYICSGDKEHCRAVLRTDPSELKVLMMSSSLAHADLGELLMSCSDKLLTTKIAGRLDLSTVGDKMIKRLIKLELIDPVKVIGTLAREFSGLTCKGSAKIFSNGIHLQRVTGSEILWTPDFHGTFATKPSPDSEEETLRDGKATVVFHNGDVVEQRWKDGRLVGIESFTCSPNCATLPNLAGVTIGKGMKWRVSWFSRDDGWADNAYWPEVGDSCSMKEVDDVALFWKYVEHGPIGWNPLAREHALAKRCEMLAKKD